MSVTSVSSLTATALSSYGSFTGSANRLPKAVNPSVARNELPPSNGRSQEISTGTQASLGQSYGHLDNQTSVGESAGTGSSTQSVLNSYLQNSSAAANAAAAGSRLKTSA